MKRSLNLAGVYFCGNKASDYAIEQGFLDYATLAKAFDAVLQNNIMSVEPDYWEMENGMIDNSDEIENYNEPEIFQYYIISGAGAEILEDYTDEIVYYNSVLDMYVWGVTHWGTSWDYVLTDIPLNCKDA